VVTVRVVARNSFAELIVIYVNVLSFPLSLAAEASVYGSMQRFQSALAYGGVPEDERTRALQACKDTLPISFPPL
jgi:hypothetical protein